MKAKLTIGMATYDDYDGCYFTLQALRFYHDLRDVELLVVDNKPDSKASPHLKNIVERFAPGTAGTRYIPAAEIVGTSAPRDRVFAEARGEAVLCIDSHVLLAPGSVARLLDWYEKHPDSLDLLSGPLILDDFGNITTHFIDFWRGEMWGIWGQAWETPCAGDAGSKDGHRGHRDHGEKQLSNSDSVSSVPSVASSPDRFSVIEGPGGKAKFIALEMGSTPLSSSARCGIEYPDLPYAGHERALQERGFKPLGFADNDEFDVPGMGLGLFSCRKEAWLGFNPDFRGFGGEELYVHEKFRQAGRRCVCLGFLKWLHRFGHAGGVKYPLTRWHKLRNYVLGALELGLPLEPIFAHFVASGLVPQGEWDALVADPKSPLPPADVIRRANGIPDTIPEIFNVVQKIPRDLDKHMPRLAELASQCPRVTEFSKRRESLIAFAYALEEKEGHRGHGEKQVSDSNSVSSVSSVAHSLHSYNAELSDPTVQHLLKLAPFVTVHNKRSADVPDIEETDLLFIDSTHTESTLAGELERYSPRVTRYIVLHDTHLHAQRGEDGGPGLATAIKNFVESDGLQGKWFVASHTNEQYGLTVLGRRPEDKPAQTIVLWPKGFGPGTELKKILHSLGVNPSPSCDCNGKAELMDRWGVEECRAKRDTIVGWMKEGQTRWGWSEKMKAAALAAVTGIAFKINPFDPFPGIIDEAIRRAGGEGRMTNV